MIALYLISIFLYTLYSYSQTDPNIIYSYHPVFLQFQTTLWRLGLDYRFLSTLMYGGLMTLLFYAYSQIISQVRQNRISRQTIIKTVITAAVFLLAANPALSHDIFNYIFNARMVGVYHVDPHIHTAQEFAFDNWTRFLHNIHTPAPYGYGWTMISLMPFFIGMGSLKMTLLAFKLFVALFFVWLVVCQAKLQTHLKIKNKEALWALWIMNPLVLIETFGNGHNDVVMMAPAVAATYCYWQYRTTKIAKYGIFAFVLLLFSVSIKYATIVLLAVWVIDYISHKMGKRIQSWHIHAAALSAPLLTVRSQQFLPWYLMWPMAFLPMITDRRIISLMVVFSYASLMRYLPFLYLPTFDKPIDSQTQRVIEVAITFGIPVVVVIYTQLKQSAQRLFARK